MSKIEEAFRSEKEAAEKAAETKAENARVKAAKKWSKWAAEEKPRIALFRRKLNKAFPCLEGDYTVSPRDTPGYLKGHFTAVLTVRSKELKLREVEKGFALFVPEDTGGSYMGWKTEYARHELTTDADLKHRIKKFIEDRDYLEQKARDYYDRMPIGNTD